MAFKTIDVASKARGGSEMMRDRLINGLKGKHREDLLEHFDFHNSRVRDFDSSKQSILLLHDLPGDPESDHLKQDKGARWAQMVFVSHWQHQQYMQHYGLSGENCKVINNAIEPVYDTIEILARKGWEKPPPSRSPWGGGVRQSDLLPLFQIAGSSEENPIRLIYHTTPHRGLEILAPVFYELYDNMLEEGIHLHLDVYSSFSIYGWLERDAPYKQVFDLCHQHPHITYHGAKPNAEIREALAKAHFFPFPSIWPETSCIAMIEAMASGTHVVHSNLAALPETAGGNTTCYPFVKDRDEHATILYTEMVNAIKGYLGDSDFRRTVETAAEFARRKYSVIPYIKQWITLLDSLKSPVD